METITVTVDEDGIARLELNRPKVLNALNSQLMSEVRQVLSNLAANEDVKALIITGRGRGFCAGADLSSPDASDLVCKITSQADLISEKMRHEFNPMMELIYEFPRPVITAVNGIAAGGGAALALCADIVLLSDKASIKVLQVPKLGIVADLGANWLLPRIVGRSRSMGMCLLGDSISAEKLMEWGLAWEQVANEHLAYTAREIARRLANVPVGAVLSTRRLVDNASHRTYLENLDDERHVQRQLVSDSEFFQKSIREFTSIR